MKNRSKVLVAVALLGLVIMGVFAYFINQIILADNTTFEEEVQYIYIRKTDNFTDVVKKLNPLLDNIDYFQLVADKKNIRFDPVNIPLKKG